MKISFVIPFFNHWELTHQLLFDIHSKSKLVDEVIVVNNGSSETHGLAWWQDAKLLPLRVVSVKENEGFLLAANRGIKAALGDVVALISNDVRVWGNLAMALDLTYRMRPHAVSGGKLYEGDTGWNSFDGTIFPYVEGWLLAAHADTWKKLDYFDERYAPNDYEDVDFSTKAREAGIQLVELSAGLATHIGGQTLGYNPDRETLTLANREKFRQKWITTSLVSG